MKHPETKKREQLWGWREKIFYLLLCEQAKTTIRNEGNIDNDTFDRDEIQFDESEHVELKKTMMM